MTDYLVWVSGGGNLERLIVHANSSQDALEKYLAKLNLDLGDVESETMHTQMITPVNTYVVEWRPRLVRKETVNEKE